ncbi:Arginyl-tRNA synthetase [Spraguea lophii 42_110]|uniref:arginine--tRNA ligase n=1 Tax=Spraguea lophii (strain 42_110) TaxID=1358809 RepID=S7XRE4_SPRLO|nr:Arginyl-tRNA synthetase [Spraguea lophii 42_110]
MDMNKIFMELATQLSPIIGCEIEDVLKMLELPKKPKSADITLQLAKMYKNCKDKAKEISEKIISKNLDIIDNIEVAGTIFKIRLNKKKYAMSIIKDILTSKEKYRQTDEGKGKNIIIEYSSPNIAKIFHAGHIRSTVLGNFVKNLYSNFGYNAISINYLGDWGRQFGLLAVGYKKYGDEKLLNEDAIKHLYDIYVKINKDANENEEVMNEAREHFKQMENGNEEYLKQWETFRNKSIENYKITYKKLNISFDIYSGESFYGEKGKSIIMNTENLVEDKDGSKYFDLGNLGKFLVIKKDGSTLYSTRDIAAAIDRTEKYNPEKSIYIVASQQDLHFRQLFQTLSTYGIDMNKLVHVNFGMVKGMSSRKGTVVFLEDIIKEAKNAVLEVMKKNEEKFSKIENVEETATQLAVSSIIIQDFSAKRVKNYEFDMIRNTSFEGETGPYLQYTHCRLESIKNNNSIYDINTIIKEITKVELEEELLSVLFYLLKYPLVLEDARQDYEPCKVVTYLMTLSAMANSLFSKFRVLNQEENIAKQRLLVFESIKVVLGNGMKILGMKPLLRM